MSPYNVCNFLSKLVLLSIKPIEFYNVLCVDVTVLYIVLSIYHITKQISLLHYVLHLHYIHLGNALRLVGGPTPNEGRVEVFHNGNWGAVCGHGWWFETGKFLCDHLGIEGLPVIQPAGTYGESTNNAVLEGFRCDASYHTHPFRCGYGWDAATCGPLETAALKCDAVEQRMLSNIFMFLIIWHM